jgi:HSP20 family protein
MTTGTGLAPVKGFGSLLARDPFYNWQNRINRLFEETFGTFALPGEETFALTAWTPSCDIYETDNAIVVKAELPGVKRENVNIKIENNLLTIRGERKFEEEAKKENYHRIERSYGEFMRSFTLPVSIDTKKVTAEFKDGMLKVLLPKLEEAKPKAIDIKVG